MDRDRASTAAERGPVGRRIRLVATPDPYTRMKPGTEGTVMFVDSVGTHHVNWDDGSSLGLIPGEDAWIYLTPDVEGDV